MINPLLLHRLLLGTAVLLLLALYGFTGPAFHLHAVKVTGDAGVVDELEIRKGLRLAGSMSLLRGDFDALAAHLEGLPPVASAEVDYQYPHNLALRVAARQAIARSVDGGLIDANGEWYATAFSGTLPLFDMDRASMPLGAELLRAAAPRLERAGLGVTQLHRGADGWRLFLSNGSVLLLGEERVHQRFDRFVRSLPRLREVFAAGYGNLRFDLRYPHGMALAGARRLLAGAE